MAYTNINTKTNKLECRLCPHNCNIADGHSGLCNIRTNSNMNLKLPYKGILSAINIDPIEKKPLYHFFPGTQILSLGFYGCNFHCQFCQNHSISQNLNSYNKTYISPAEIVKTAVNKRIPSVAYTYSEPVIHFEYVMECAELAHNNGLNNVLVTNGYLNSGPAKELLQKMDAVNVDLKAFTNKFYFELGGKIEPVKTFIKLASELTHLEVTTLVIPGKNDSVNEIMSVAKFIASLDTKIPLHLSAYYPVYNYEVSSTPKDTILGLCKKVSKILNYVHPGNIY